MTKPSQQAFPCLDLTFFDERLIGGEALPGLTKREYFAAIALQGLLSNTQFAEGSHNAELAVEAADALIAELNREQGVQP